MAAPKILTPVDGSPASLRAVDFALKMLLQNPEGRLVLLHVQNVGSIDPVGVAAMAEPEWFQDVASKASEEALKGALSKCKAASVCDKACGDIDRRILRLLPRIGPPPDRVPQHKPHGLPTKAGDGGRVLGNARPYAAALDARDFDGALRGVSHASSLMLLVDEHTQGNCNGWRELLSERGQFLLLENEQ